MKLIYLLFAVFFSPALIQAQELNNKLDIAKVLQDSCKSSDYIFIGETHTVKDEQVVINNFDALYKCGVRNVAFEVPYYLTDKMNEKNINITEQPYKDILDSFLSDYIKAAKKSGLKVFGIDSSLNENSGDRDTTMQYHLTKDLPTPKGKTVVFVGLAHAQKLKGSVAALLTGEGKKITVIVMESANSIFTTALLLRNFDLTKEFFTAFTTYYYSKDIKLDKSFAVKSVDVDLEVRNSARLSDKKKYKYVDLVDYIFFLNDNDSVLTDLGKKIMHKN